MTSSRTRRRAPRISARPAAVVAVVALAAVATACGSPDPAPTASSPSASSSSTTSEEAPSDDPTPESTQGATDPREPFVASVTAALAGERASGLAAPWGLARTPDGSILVTERDSHRVLLLPDTAGEPRPLTGPGAENLAQSTAGEGEAGLLGVAVSPTFAEDHLVFFFRTAEKGNEVVRGELTGQTLGELTTILGGIPSGTNHNGGQLAFGPDGFLYVSTGDAGSTTLAQHPDSLAGKILRVTADGSVPDGNPVPGSPVWSLGHRNVQGMGWSADGRMFASEFGQDTLDELNLVVAGGNYGWPSFEGPGGAADGFVDPLVTWLPDEASPSGLVVTDEGVYLAGLRGQALLRVPLAEDGVGEPQTLLAGELGRLRAVLDAGDGTLEVLTNNTDGRGEPREGDDRLAVVTLTR